MPRKNKKSVSVSRKTNSKVSKARARSVSEKPPEREATAGKPNAALLKEAERIKAKLVANDKDSAAAKYEVAVRVKNVMEGDAKYEPEAVKKLARILGLKWQLLYAWAEVARAWSTRAAFLKVISRLNNYGMRMTWSHMQELAGVPEGKRDRLVEKVLSKGLSVRELKERINGSGAKRVAEDADATDSNQSLKETIIALSETAGAHTVALARWREALTQLPGGKAPADLTKPLERAREKVTAMIEEGKATVKALESALGLESAGQVLLERVR